VSMPMQMAAAAKFLVFQMRPLGGLQMIPPYEKLSLQKVLYIIIVFRKRYYYQVANVSYNSIVIEKQVVSNLFANAPNQGLGCKWW